MINKFEAIGIFASIACMVLALFLLRVETAPEFAQQQADAQPAAVVVATDGSSPEAVLGALAESVDGTGKLGKTVVDDVIIGHGDAVKKGDTVTVHYIGTLQTGQQFDNSYLKSSPFTFTVGEGRVIEGWEEGLIGMQVEGKRILVIPPGLGYGASNVGPIPANSTLVFAIELLSIN